MSDERELSVDGVSVRKWVDTENFRVPAVSFELESGREEPTTVRLVDRIPESFPMDRIGFHPEHGSESWTAYPDQRVGFERELAPGETVTTVYGVRVEDAAEIEQFTGEPEIEVLATGEVAATDEEEGLGEATIEDIAPPERTDVVRDVIEGNRETVPGLDEQPGPDDAEAAGEPAPDDLLGDVGEGSEPAQPADGEPATPADGAAEPSEAGAEVGDAVPDDSDEESVEPAAADAAGSGEPAEPPGATGEEPADPAAAGTGGHEQADAQEADDGEDEPTVTPGASPGNVAAALLEEIEAGRVDDETLEGLRRSLGAEIPESVDTRIAHLQSRVSDMEAYADAMEAFIDSKGTARQLLEELESEVEALDRRTAELADDLREDVDVRMDEARDHREALEADLADLDADIEQLEDDLDHEVRLLDEDIEALEADLADLEDRLEDTEEDLEAEVTAVEEDIEAVRDDVEDVLEWRNQLSDVLGG